LCIVIEFETNESACLLHVRDDYSARYLVNDAVCCSKLTATWKLLHVRLTSVPVLTRPYRDIRKSLSIKHYHYLAYMARPRQLLRELFLYLHGLALDTFISAPPDAIGYLIPVLSLARTAVAEWIVHTTRTLVLEAHITSPYYPHQCTRLCRMWAFKCRLTLW